MGAGGWCCDRGLAPLFSRFNLHSPSKKLLASPTVYLLAAICVHIFTASLRLWQILYRNVQDQSEGYTTVRRCPRAHSAVETMEAPSRPIRVPLHPRRKPYLVRAVTSLLCGLVVSGCRGRCYCSYR